LGLKFAHEWIVRDRLLLQVSALRSKHPHSATCYEAKRLFISEFREVILMLVGRMCVREVDTARADESVAAAAERMHQRAVGTLIVVNDSDRVVGILTDRDLVSRVLAKDRSPTETSVRDVMTLAPKTVTEWTTIESALLIMRTGRFRRVPVVDQDNKLVGLISLDDILILLAEEFSQVGRLLKRETPRAIMEASKSSASDEAKLDVGG
jgi:CBS domain-containing protein